MNPEQETKNEDDEKIETFPPMAGDVIGDTAYSERFVLKILLKLANLETLKQELKEKSFEDDICVLWDMTAERDVVLFLQKHEMLKLLNFALPEIDSPRIIEILIGIIGNMCCWEEVVSALMKIDTLLSLLLDYIHTDDSLVLIQLLRLVSACLFIAKEDNANVWIDLFIKMEYSSALYFILTNSSNKDLLISAIENFNAICSTCNVETSRVKFFTHFITKDSVQSLTAAFTELTVNQKELCTIDELERILLVSLQILLYLSGYDKSSEIYSSSKESITSLISVILSYHEKKLTKRNKIDTDLIDIIESIISVVKVLHINETCKPDKYFIQSHNMWKYLVTKFKHNESSKGDDNNDINKQSSDILSILCTLLSIYISKCSEDNLIKAWDHIKSDYKHIVKLVKDKELQTSVTNRVNTYKTRLKDNDYSYDDKHQT